jgi:ABC-2 type transport system ATP-binding protein
VHSADHYPDASVATAAAVRPSDRKAVAAVELDNVTKFYPRRRSADGKPVAAVQDLNLRVEPGEVYGLLGPNGAGKSTTIRMIATLLEPTTGRISVCGIDARTRQRDVRRVLGVALGGERSLYWKLTARANLEYFAALHGHSRRRSRARIMEVLEQMDLADRADDYIESYSTGMRQRLVIARALLNSPRVLLLDEPASGLDPRAAHNLHERVLRLREAGHTILLTTHDMAEADALSDRLGIIDNGKLVAEGTPAQLKHMVDGTQVVHARLELGSPDALSAIVADLRQITRTTVDEACPAPVLTLLGRADDNLVPRLIAVAGQHGATVLRVENEPVSLKDVFLSLTGRSWSPEPDHG